MTKIQTINHEKQILADKTPTTYIIRCKDWYKIGYSKNGLANRLSTIRTSNPFGVSLVYAIQTSLCQELELALHQLFFDRERRGEWFKLLPTDKQRIDSFLTALV